MSHVSGGLPTEPDPVVVCADTYLQATVPNHSQMTPSRLQFHVASTVGWLWCCYCFQAVTCCFCVKKRAQLRGLLRSKAFVILHAVSNMPNPKTKITATASSSCQVRVLAHGVTPQCHNHRHIHVCGQVIVIIQHSVMTVSARW